MKVVNALSFLVTLAVVLAAWAAYAFEPGMLAATPWGRVHIGLLAGGAYLLGAVVIALYLLATWANFQATLTVKAKEIKRLEAEISQLKKLHIEEMAVIPDRDLPTFS